MLRLSGILLACLLAANALPACGGRPELEPCSDASALVQVHVDASAAPSTATGRPSDRFPWQELSTNRSALLQMLPGKLTGFPFGQPAMLAKLRGWKPFRETLREKIVAAVGLTIGGVSGATAMMARPAVRRQWRNVKMSSLVVSIFGGMVLFLEPASPLTLLSVVFPICAFAEPKWDIFSMYRGVKQVGFLKVFLAWLFATGHHVGLVLIIKMIGDIATLRSYSTMAAFQWQLVATMILEVVEWAIEALVLTRSLPPWGHWLLVITLSLHCATIGINLYRNLKMQICLFVFDQCLLLTGCVAGVLCGFWQVKTSTYEYREEEYREAPRAKGGGLVRRRSIARENHEEALRQNSEPMPGKGCVEKAEEDRIGIANTDG
mmetsp:Transcript_105801/g.309482  ORF Transcript_105801/g.309482 Transcript_105801/m.309482 type:complete len:378 (-) Transcript_105801:42-1175(-)